MLGDSIWLLAIGYSLFAVGSADPVFVTLYVPEAANSQ
jgi:hypothetical protein